MVKEAIGAVAILKNKGIEAFLVNARFIKPLDSQLLKFIADNFKLIITIEEGCLTGGFGSAVLEFYESQDISDKVKVKRLGIPDLFPTFAKKEQLLKIYGLDSVSIAEKTINTLKEEVLWQK